MTHLQPTRQATTPDPWCCQVCGRHWVVPSLADMCCWELK